MSNYWAKKSFLFLPKPNRCDVCIRAPHEDLHEGSVNASPAHHQLSTNPPPVYHVFEKRYHIFEIRYHVCSVVPIFGTTFWKTGARDR